MDKFFDWVPTDIQNGVLHHKVDKGQEFLELTEFVGGFWLFFDVEPSLTDVVEVVSDNLAESANPSTILSFNASVGELIDRI
jgi:hypothetical protein